MNIKQE